MSPQPSQRLNGHLASVPALAQDAGALLDDSRHRVSHLAAASRRPESVKPDTHWRSAVTTMLLKDYSQLPVMAGEREVKGVVSWRSLAMHFSTGTNATQVRHYMAQPRMIGSDESLFVAMREVAANDYVLIQDATKKVCGIVTTSDIHAQFTRLTEPFLLVGEIEVALRHIVDQQVPAAMLKAARDPADPRRHVERAADLTFGEQVRLLEQPEVWSTLQIPLERKQFTTFLQDIRQVRNDVMHFYPDGIPDESVGHLRNLIQLLDWLRLGAGARLG